MTQKRNLLAGKRLKKFRIQMNWTRDDLAYASGVSVRTIYNYEVRGLPVDERKLWSLCKAMNIHIADILGVSLLNIEDLLLDQETSSRFIVEIMDLFLNQ